MKKLPDPEAYINFVDHLDIDTLNSTDVKEMYGLINLACLQIEDTKRNKSEEEINKLEIVRLRGVLIFKRLGKKMRELGISPV